MIVNPAEPGIGALFEGEDGGLYQLQGMDAERGAHGLGQLFLGDDGALYRAHQANDTPSVASTKGLMEGAGQNDVAKLGGYLLAADGTLYELTK